MRFGLDLKTDFCFVQSLKLQPFSPPNLIQTTSAAFMSRQQLVAQTHQTSQRTIDATLLVLPSPTIPRPRPSVPSQRNLTTTHDDENLTWPSDILRNVHVAVFFVFGEQATLWQRKDASGRTRKIAARKRGDVGEGSMYI